MTSTSLKQSQNESKWIFRAMAIGWAIVVAILLINIVSAPSDIGSPATESQAVVRANERLLEMVKWTISTILLVGGGLIGLNWYHSEKRMEEVLATTTQNTQDQIKGLRDSLDSRITLLEQLSDRLRESMRSTRNDVQDLQLAVQDVDTYSSWSLLFTNVGSSTNWIGRNVSEAMHNPFVTNRVKRNVLSQFIRFATLGVNPEQRETMYGMHLADIITEAHVQGFEDEAQVLRDLHREMEARHSQACRGSENSNDPNIPQ